VVPEYSQCLDHIFPRSEDERSMLDDRLREGFSSDQNESRLLVGLGSELDSFLGGFGGEYDGGGRRVDFFRVADEEGAGEGVDLRRKGRG